MIDFNIDLPKFNIFVVGGFVRDHLLGISSKDIDIVCEAKSFDEMLSWVDKTHEKIFLSKPEFFTIRALGPDKKAYDYVLARKESGYTDGRHPDNVEIGTIFDDLKRRDFTVGAMAYNIHSKEILDPFGGKEDLRNKLLRCVGSAEERFQEDPLRILRAIRFCITKEFEPDSEIQKVFRDKDWAIKIRNTVSPERIREELQRCFHFDSLKMIKILSTLDSTYLDILFEKETGILWLKPQLRI